MVADDPAVRREIADPTLVLARRGDEGDGRSERPAVAGRGQGDGARARALVEREERDEERFVVRMRAHSRKIDGRAPEPAAVEARDPYRLEAPKRCRRMWRDRDLHPPPRGPRVEAAV